ncbi:hypothetical protein F5Y19DRAFT_413346 [Xylariaceae sp. FL1651]|nr:hypothetical protein F5Y19DRAFT_413346 [Xylariaceae sp. FL1651]
MLVSPLLVLKVHSVCLSVASNARSGLLHVYRFLGSAIAGRSPTSYQLVFGTRTAAWIHVHRPSSPSIVECAGWGMTLMLGQQEILITTVER